MSPGLVAEPPREVLGAGHDPHHVARKPQTAHAPHRAQDGGPAGHVVLHVLHSLGGLDRNAPGVEGEALAHQRQRLVVGVAAGVAQDDHPRLLVGPPGDREESPHPFPLQLLGPEDRALQAGLAGDLLCLFGQVGRCRHVAGAGLQRSGQVGRLPVHHAPADRLAPLLQVFLGHQHHRRLHRRRRPSPVTDRVRLELVEAPSRHHQPFGPRPSPRTPAQGSERGSRTTPATQPRAPRQPARPGRPSSGTLCGWTAAPC